VVKDWTVEDHDYLRSHTPRSGLATKFQGRPLSDLAREVVEIAHAGLRARRQARAQGNDETIYLAPLDRAVASGLAPADELLDQVAGRMAGLLRAACSANTPTD
jgi:glutamate--cysteine ligase